MGWRLFQCVFINLQFMSPLMRDTAYPPNVTSSWYLGCYSWA